MFVRKFPRVFRYGLYGGVAVGGSLAAASKLHDYDSLAIVRITRTAYTAMDIGRMYQVMLYSKEWDKESEEYIELRSRAHQIGAEKLLQLCKANKGVYIKVGQHVGALDYLLPSEYVTTMRILHKDAPRNSIEELYQVIREDLNRDPEEMFDEFEGEPLGTASLAQVHKAKLKDGTEVAVKVQHHFVRKNLDIDMRWMAFVVMTLTKIFPEFQMQWLIEETKKNITNELNFRREGENSEKLAKMFHHYTWLKVPKIFWEYSTERVLVMEYVEGGLVNDLKYIKEHKINKLDVCAKLGTLYSQMIFNTGFVHSDPHPGNILIKQNPGEKDVTIYLLDHGLYAQLTDEFRYNYSKLWLSILDRDKAEMRIYAEKMGIRKELFGLFACMVTGRPWDSIMKGISQTKVSSEEKNIFQKELPNLFPQISQCLEFVDRQALLVMKTNDLIRSIEYALGTHERMNGFMVMSKCCLQSVYQHDYEKEPSLIKKQYLVFKYAWSTMLLYFYTLYLQIIYAIDL